MTTHKEKLVFPNYIFEINDIDISDVYVEYELYDMEITSWKDGKKQEPEIYPQMTIELTGKYNNQEIYFGFDLKKGLKHLNRFKKDEMVEISDLVVEGETFMVNLEGKTTSVFLNRPTNTKEDMYKEITNFYVLKLKKNHFLFKVQIPTERVFAYFEVHFKE
jgi:hypothetical protein